MYGMKRINSIVNKRLYSSAQLKIIPTIIAGHPYQEGKMVDATSPYTNESLGKVPQADAGLVRKAAAACARAQQEWAETTIEHRIDALRAFDDGLEKNRDKLIDSLITEGGASGFKAQFESSMNRTAPLAEHLKEFLLDKRTTFNSGIFNVTPETYVLRKPVGVIAQICPFNFPLLLTMRTLSASVLTGNGLVFKPSPHTTTYGPIICEIAESAFPSGLINCVQGSAETALALCDEPLVKRVLFIGSSYVGRDIGVRCAQNFKPFTLECGGKSPLIVCEDADIASTMGQIVPGFMMHSGQVCVASTRILAHASVGGALKAAVAGAVQDMAYAAPDGSGGLLSPLIAPSSVARCSRMVQDALDKGAELVVQKELPANLQKQGNYFPPTVLANVTPDMEIYDEEAFGPVTYINTFSNEDEAIAVANSSKYGLSAAIHSKDIDRARILASRIESGGVSVNGGTMNDNGMAPFGGVKVSGMGRQNGREEVEFLTDACTIYVFPEGKK